MFNLTLKGLRGERLNFKGILDLGEHLAKEHRKSGTETECPACPRKFDNRYWMNLHVKSFHLNGKKKCTECNKFITLNNYAINKLNN